MSTLLSNKEKRDREIMKAEVQNLLERLDSGFRRNDGKENISAFYGVIK
jgi:hypothetical protein